MINPAAHSAAQQKDAELQQILVRGGQLPPLFCVPVLVKVHCSVTHVETTLPLHGTHDKQMRFAYAWAPT